jgi:hypothetical protein
MVGENRISFLKLGGLFLAIISIFIYQSCTKDDLTRPVRISLTVIINEQYKTNNTLLFERGEITLREIQFDGKREAGGDYSFNTESGKNFGPNYFYPPSSPQETLANFDLPQGVYSGMRWKFELSDGLERLEQDDDDDDNYNSETPGLILDGSYINNEREMLRIRIEIDPFESFDCLALADNGNKNISIVSGITYNAILYLDPYFVFRAISSESLEEADYSDDELSPVLLISSDSNKELYEIILFRLQQSVKIVVR